MDFEKLAQAMGDLDEDTVVEMLEAVMEDGGSEADKAMEACQKGMELVGNLFEEGEYFVGDLIYAGELMTQAVEILTPALVGSDSSGPKTKMILCTVKDDLHDIGKNIVRAMLEAAGFDVIDLGIDVDPEKVVEVAKEQNIKIVALSGVLTLALDSMKDTQSEMLVLTARSLLVARRSVKKHVQPWALMSGLTHLRRLSTSAKPGQPNWLKNV